MSHVDAQSRIKASGQLMRHLAVPKSSVANIHKMFNRNALGLKSNPTGKQPVMMRQFLAVFAALAALIAIALFLAASQIKAFYLERAGLRLDPFGLSVYVEENQKLQNPVDVVVIGDSRVSMWTPRPNETARSIIWRGIGGQSSAQVGGRFSSDVIALEPKVVVIAVGINDIMASSALGRPKLADRQIQERLFTMASAAREAGITVYVATIVRPHRPSLLKRWLWSEDVYDRTAAVNTLIRRNDRSLWCVLDFDMVLGGDATGPLPAQFATDELHLNGRAYSIMNELTERALKKGCYGL